MAPKAESSQIQEKQNAAKNAAASQDRVVAAGTLSKITEKATARQRLLEESLSDKNLYTDICDDSDLEVGNEINKLEEIKQKHRGFLREMKRKEKKAKVLFANLKVHHSRDNNIVRSTSRERLAAPATKEAHKLDAVKIFSEKLKQQLASDANSHGTGQGNVALKIIMNIESI